MNDEKIMNKNKASGFTLIELMIAIVLLAVLASLAAPSFVDALERRRLVGAAESFYSGIQFARSEAIKQNTNIIFHYMEDMDGNGVKDDWCYGVDDDTSGVACHCSTSPSTCTVNTLQKVITSDNYNNISIVAATFSDTTITFDAMNGMPATGDSGSFTFSSPNTSSQFDKVVKLNAVGRVKME